MIISFKKERREAVFLTVWPLLDTTSDNRISICREQKLVKRTAI